MRSTNPEEKLDLSKVFKNENLAPEENKENELIARRYARWLLSYLVSYENLDENMRSQLQQWLFDSENPNTFSQNSESFILKDQNFTQVPKEVKLNPKNPKDFGPTVICDIALFLKGRAMENRILLKELLGNNEENFRARLESIPLIRHIGGFFLRVYNVLGNTWILDPDSIDSIRVKANAHITQEFPTSIIKPLLQKAKSKSNLVTPAGEAPPMSHEEEERLSQEKLKNEVQSLAQELKTQGFIKPDSMGFGNDIEWALQPYEGRNGKVTVFSRPMYLWDETSIPNIASQLHGELKGNEDHTILGVANTGRAHFIFYQIQIDPEHHTIFVKLEDSKKEGGYLDSYKHQQVNDQLLINLMSALRMNFKDPPYKIKSFPTSEEKNEDVAKQFATVFVDRNPLSGVAVESIATFLVQYAAPRKLSLIELLGPPEEFKTKIQQSPLRDIAKAFSEQSERTKAYKIVKADLLPEERKVQVSGMENALISDLDKIFMNSEKMIPKVTYTGKQGDTHDCPYFALSNVIYQCHTLAPNEFKEIKTPEITDISMRIGNPHLGASDPDLKNIRLATIRNSLARLGDRELKIQEDDEKIVFYDRNHPDYIRKYQEVKEMKTQNHCESELKSLESKIGAGEVKLFNLDEDKPPDPIIYNRTLKALRSLEGSTNFYLQELSNKNDETVFNYNYKDRAEYIRQVLQQLSKLDKRISQGDSLKKVCKALKDDLLENLNLLSRMSDRAVKFVGPAADAPARAIPIASAASVHAQHSIMRPSSPNVDQMVTKISENQEILQKYKTGFTRRY